MRSTKTFSPEDFQLLSRFESAHNTLLQEQFQDRLEKPLGYWALANDRRLPFVLLGRKLSVLLETPFEDLLATPGIGKKKIESMVMLLERAIADNTNGLGTRPSAVENSERSVENAPFDASTVSEACWSQWCKRIESFGLGYERLGRLIPSLQSLPTVIWNTPLDLYLDKSLEEIRSLKTHGKKRVEAVVTLFYQLNEILAGVEHGGTLALRLVPRPIAQVEDWISLASEDSHMLSETEIESCLTKPLLSQIQNDAGTMVRDLAKARLGVDGVSESIRGQSRKYGVTRARIYQLLDDCASIIQVRWPNGRSQLQRLAMKLENDGLLENRKQVEAICEFLYPTKQLEQFEQPVMAS